MKIRCKRNFKTIAFQGERLQNSSLESFRNISSSKRLPENVGFLDGFFDNNGLDVELALDVEVALGRRLTWFLYSHPTGTALVWFG